MRTVIFDIDGTLANVDHRRDILKKNLVIGMVFFRRWKMIHLIRL